MIALIPGITSALASLQKQQTAGPAPQDVFPQLLDSASQSLQSGEALAPPAPAHYEVQAGDNLTAIAKKFGVTDSGALAQANHLKNPDQLQVGQVLNLPENTVTASQPAPKPTVAAAAKLGVNRAQGLAAAVNSHQGRRQLVSASWYGAQLHGRLMANGQPFNMYADTVAHKNLPLGTQLTLTNPQNGNAVRVKVTDRGPYISGRSLDLSYGAARKLGVLQNGVAKVWMEGG